MPLTDNDKLRIKEVVQTDILVEIGKNIDLSTLKKVAENIEKFIRNPKPVDQPDLFQDLYMHPDKIIPSISNDYSKPKSTTTSTENLRSESEKRTSEFEDHIAGITYREVREHLVECIDIILNEQISASTPPGLDEEQTKLYEKKAKQQIEWNKEEMLELVGNMSNDNEESLGKIHEIFNNAVDSFVSRMSMMHMPLTWRLEALRELGYSPEQQTRATAPTTPTLRTNESVNYEIDVAPQTSQNPNNRDSQQNSTQALELEVLAQSVQPQNRTRSRRFIQEPLASSAQEIITAMREQPRQLSSSPFRNSSQGSNDSDTTERGENSRYRRITI